jgi:non-specific serine/threonine protein kinase/serine/threonine-protein kinase
MTQRWQDVRRLFEMVRELPVDQRQHALNNETQHDVELRNEVERLLRAEADAGDFLAQPLVPALFGRLPEVDDDPVLAEGDRLGAYRVVRRFGQGGVSAVYLGERCDGIYDQQVAIKVIKRGMDTASVIARFHSERQILAALDHPFIARILDGGTTLDGLPYFVMELVEGKTLTEYLECNTLGLREILELFVRICSAVAYAHRRQVIHRDLKPVNIIVDGEGNPKLLDFGLAKVLSTNSEDDTAAADRMLTPAYASPEQVVGGPLTPASDVYSLGVVMHEMLLGTRPNTETTVSLPSVDPEGPKDLTYIVRMALREEPERRYRSADQLREDVERHLMGMPIEARHGTTGYRLQRYVHRHKIGLAASLLVATSLVISSAAVLWQREVAKLEHTRAERRYQELRELANLMVVEFDDAIDDMPGAPPVRKALVTSALSYLVALEPESAGDPLLQREIARAYMRLGDVQRQSYGLSGGDSAGALDNLNRALRILQSLVTHPDSASDDREILARCHHRIALTLRQMGDWNGDLEHARQAVDIHREIVSENPASSLARSALADALQTLGVALSNAGEAVATLQTFERVVTLRQELFEHDSSVEEARADLAAALRNLGLGQEMNGNLTASLDAYERSLRHLQSLLELNPASVRFRSALTRNYQQLGNNLCALDRVSEGLEHLRQGSVLGHELQRADPNNAAIRRRLVQTCRDYGLALTNAGSFDEAVGVLTEALDLLDPWAAESQENAQVQVLLAEVTAVLGRAYELSGSRRTELENLRQALANYRRSQSLWNQLEQNGLLAPVHTYEPSRLEAAIERCEETLGELS